MAIIYSADLSAANNSSMMTNLDTINDSSQKLITNINNFIDNSQTELIGSGYDAVRTKMALYVDALNKQINISNNLKSNINSANNNMLNFMEGYSMLDDSRIPEIRGKIRTIEALIEKLELSDNVDQASLASLNQLLSELKRLLTKLEALAPTDAVAFGMVSSVATDVHAYGNAILNFKIPNIDGTIPNTDNIELGNKLNDIEDDTGGVGFVKTEKGMVVFNQKGYYDEKKQWHDWNGFVSELSNKNNNVDTEPKIISL